MRKKSKLFFINGTILTLTALLMRFVTLVFNIYVTNQIGPEAVGVFTLVMAVYMFFITIATSGLNVAVTIIVSEKFATNKNNIAIKTIRTCILFSFILGICSSMLILICSNFITKICLHNLVSIKPLIYIAIGLPFIAMSSCINSYFTATRKAYINAITQIFEFIIKMISTIILLNINIQKGVELICISLILADVISEICSFCFTYIFYIIDIRLKKLNRIQTFGQRFNILKISLPVAITSYIRSGLSTLKQLIIPTQLEKSGYSNSIALSKYGIINGMVLPVLTFPTVLIYSYCQLIIPEFSTYVAQNNYKAINYISKKMFKIISNFSICICSIFLIFSNELGLAIYNNIETGFYFKLLSPLVFFMYMDHIIDSILKGLNKQFGVMCCNILDLTITTCIIYILLPIYGIKGYIFSILFSEILNFSISFYQMIKYSKIKINIIDWIIIPFICSFIAYFFKDIFYFNFSTNVINLTLNIILFCIVYIISFIIISKRAIT